jgi:hypothetical protein
MKNKIGSLIVLVTLALMFHANVASAYYDPELGRFIQPDTIIPDLSNPQSYNRYSYCVNDPLRYTDPTGHGPTDYIPGVGPGIAEIQGNMALESMAQSHGYTSYAQARQALGMGQATAGNISAVAGVGHVTAGAANVYIMGAQEVATAGMATGPMLIGRTEQALTRGAAEQTGEATAGGINSVIKGQEGVAKSEAAAVERGDVVRGKEVTFELPSGGRTRADLVTDSKGDLNIVESKNGPSARLTPRQTEAQQAVQQGQSLIPRGGNAQAAGLTPGSPVKVNQYQVDQH